VNKRDQNQGFCQVAGTHLPLGRIPGDHCIDILDKPDFIEERGNNERGEGSLGDSDPVVVNRLLDDGIQ
jgi:hypothetical protein